MTAIETTVVCGWVFVAVFAVVMTVGWPWVRAAER